MKESPEVDGRWWNEALEEVPSEVAVRLPTVVGYRECPGGTWCVHARHRGVEVLRAKRLEFGEAADMVMTVFGDLLEEAETKGSRPPRV